MSNKSDNDKASAPQPHFPYKFEESEKPQPSKPPVYKKQDLFSPDCNCSDASSQPNVNRIEDLIAQQDADIATAEKAKKLKDALVMLLTKAKTATQECNPDTYMKLCRRWVEEDCRIADLIRKLECTVTCWRCVIECYICPLINQLVHNQQQLDDGMFPKVQLNQPAHSQQQLDDGMFPKEVDNLYALQYWHTRYKHKWERNFNHIQNVLTVWDKPMQKIEQILNDNDKLITDSLKLVGSDPSKVIYDTFFRLVPLHLAIAPIHGLNWETKGDWDTNILAKWTWKAFCKSDKGTSETDTRYEFDIDQWSMRQRLIGPQPYLIEPNKSFEHVCWLIVMRYEPIKNLLNDAENKLAVVDKQIADLNLQIQNGLKSLDNDAKAVIPSLIDCNKCKPTEQEVADRKIDPDARGE